MCSAGIAIVVTRFVDFNMMLRVCLWMDERVDTEPIAKRERSPQKTRRRYTAVMEHSHCHFILGEGGAVDAVVSWVIGY